MLLDNRNAIIYGAAGSLGSAVTNGGQDYGRDHRRDLRHDERAQLQDADDRLRPALTGDPASASATPGTSALPSAPPSENF